MRDFKNQGQLFPNESYYIENLEHNIDIELSKEILIAWQKRIYDFQVNLFQKKESIDKQKSLFNNNSIAQIDAINPLNLSPLALSFWRLQTCPQKGPALYFVMDQPKNLESPLLLYIGETIAAERRWKGEHDCKTYLSGYSEALSMASIRYQLSIRFWNDVPSETKHRRQIEQFLIKKWQPPFNKETRDRWKTPFTSDF